MKNKFEIHGETTVIFVEYHGQTMKSYISTSDLELAKKARCWMARYEYGADSFYVVGTIVEDDGDGNLLRKTTSMHRHIMGQPEGMCIDHINHIRNDNRRENLQILTRSENSAKQPEKYKERIGTGRALFNIALDNHLKDACLILAAKNQMNLSEYINHILQKEVNEQVSDLLKQVV